jgi:hypothetical protein
MVEQLLWLEIVLKGATGLVLLVLPRTFARLTGMPAAGATVWPRLLGSVLVGMAAAIALGAWIGRADGLGIGGLAAINLAIVVFIAAQLSVGGDGLARRGRALLWLVAAGLALLGLVEIAWA